MANQTSDITTYYGTPPTVFKKVDPINYKVNQFEANKTFSFTSASAESNNFTPLLGIYERTLPNVSASVTFTAPINSNGIYQFQTYYSINHLFYKYKNEPTKTYGPTDLNKTSKFLYQSASVFSIPQIKFGEGIKPDSFTYVSSSGLTLNSDRYGNIFDTNINTGSFPLQETFYEGFNEYFDLMRIPYTSYNNLIFNSGVTTSNGQQLPIGLSALFTGSSYIETELDGYYNKDYNYAISFYIKPNASEFGSGQLIIGKTNSVLNQQYPFKIELSGSGNIKFSTQGSSTLLAQVTSSVLDTSNWNYVTCQKSGSNLEIFIDTVKNSSGSFDFITTAADSLTTSSVYINNDNNLSIGGYQTDNIGSSYLNAYLDEIRIYNKSLIQDQINSLGNRSETANQILQTNRIGNVFDKSGFFVISSPNYLYKDLINSDYTLTYKSTVRRFEHSVFLSIDSGDFNATLNPTTLLDDNINMKPFATGSAFNPYITTIGLYNDKGQLLMIGKTGSPIKNRNDIDLNFSLKIDLDKPKVNL
jgi:hypothetical protein